MNKVIKIIVLIILWLVFSPLYIYLAKKWKMLKLKVSIPLAILSPFGLIVLFGLFYAGYLIYYNFDRTHHFTDEKVVERITSTQLPDFKVVNYQKGNAAFMGDYTDQIEILFETEIPESTFAHIDSLIANGNHNWSKQDYCYEYSKMWGNGMEAPQGEDEKSDRTFSIQIIKGKREAKIEHGTW